jgi:hypothetical protein
VIPALRSRLARVSKQAEPGAQLGSAEVVGEAASNATVLPRASRTKGDRFRTTCCDI